MYVHMVTLQVKPERREAVVQATVEDARSSVRDEPGCLRFDVMEDQDSPDLIHLVAVFKDRAAHDGDHLRAPHLARWMEATRDAFAGPAVVRHCSNVFPADADWR